MTTEGWPQFKDYKTILWPLPLASAAEVSSLQTEDPDGTPVLLVESIPRYDTLPQELRSGKELWILGYSKKPDEREWKVARAKKVESILQLSVEAHALRE